jgi:lipopolysaccharide export LptBFGC system permease protein LptF
MSILLSASFMITMLCRHHEVTAMRAVGLSLFSFALPVWIFALVLSGVTFWISEDLAPDCAARAEHMRNAWSASKKEKRREARLAYHNDTARRDWFFEEFSFKHAYRGILIKQFRSNDTPEWELQATRAEYKHRQWIFYDGSRNFYDSGGKLTIGPEIHFTKFRLDSLNESPRKILNHLRPVEELSIGGILRMFRFNRDISKRSRRIFLTTIFYRLTFPFSCLIGAFLGIAVTTTERAAPVSGFATAAGIMMTYYMTSQVGLVFGRNGYLPPLVAGAGPTLLFIGLGLVFLYRKR